MPTWPARLSSIGVPSRGGVAHAGGPAAAVRRVVLAVDGRLPFPAVPGLVLFYAAGAADMAYHLLPAGAGAALVPLVGPDGQTGHLGVLIGMLLILVGLVRRGLRHAA